MVLEDILSIVLPNCPSTALAKLNFGWSILDSYFSNLFYTFLISFSFHSFLFQNLQDWTLNGKIVDSFFFSSHFPFDAYFQKPAISTLDGKILHSSYFSNAIFLLKFAFKRLQEWTLDG